MADTVRLRTSSQRRGDWRMYFYDGELPVRDGVLEIPARRPEWIQRAWIMGFRSTVDGRVIADLAKHIRSEMARDEEPVEPVGCCPNECCPDSTENPCAESCVDTCCTDDVVCACKTNVTPVDETETAESGEETDDEGAADRGLSPDDDGVRSGEPSGDGSLPEGGNDGRSGDEPADGGTGDEPAD